MESPQSLFSGTNWQQLWSGEGVYFQIYLEGQSPANRSIDWEYNHQGGYGSVKMNISKSVPTDTCNHPRNRLIKVWKRTA
jgi:hypothetical protein